MLPFEIEIVLKEQICADAIATLKNILRVKKDVDDDEMGSRRYQKSKESSDASGSQRVLRSGKFDAAYDFLGMVSDELLYSSADGAGAFEDILGQDVNLRLRFFEQFEIALICFYDQTNRRMLPLRQDPKVTKNSKATEFSQAF